MTAKWPGAAASTGSKVLDRFWKHSSRAKPKEHRRKLLGYKARWHSFCGSTFSTTGLHLKHILCLLTFRQAQNVYVIPTSNKQFRFDSIHSRKNDRATIILPVSRWTVQEWHRIDPYCKSKGQISSFDDCTCEWLAAIFQNHCSTASSHTKSQ
jgi:hypothetical protein